MKKSTGKNSRNLSFLQTSLLLAIAILPLQLVAQKKVTGNAINKSSVASLAHVFKNYSVLSVDAPGLAAHARLHPGKNLDIQMDFAGLPAMRLDLVENNILSNDYKLIVGSTTGEQVFDKPLVKTYKGKLAGDNNSHVYLTVSDQSVFGVIEGNGKEYYIEPLRYFSKDAAPGVSVLYEARDVIPNSGMTCGSTEASQKTSHLENSNTQRASGTCKMVDVAIASDYSMFSKYGSAALVQERNIGIMNLMVGIYREAQFGTQYLEFKIVTQYVAAAASHNPFAPNYNENNVEIMLTNFTNWAKNSGFGGNYDMAQLWTATNIAVQSNTAVVGFANVGAMCAGNGCQVLEDFSGSALAKAALAAHETGHTLNADHDLYFPSIMSPLLYDPPYTKFSIYSLPTIANYLDGPGGTCLAPCNESLVAQFSASGNTGCTDNDVSFTDYSVGEVLSRAWDFGEGANPATSTAEVDNVTYSTPGIKEISLTVWSAYGSATITKKIPVGYALTSDELVASATAVCPNTSYTISFPAAREGAILKKYDPQQGSFVTIGQIGATPISFVSGEYAPRGEYYIALWPNEDVLPGCIAIAQLSIEILKGPKPIITGDNSVCPANPIQLQVTDTEESGPFVNYLWSPGGATTPAININPLLTSLYSVTVTNANGCSNTATKNVIVGINATESSTTNINCDKATFNWKSGVNPTLWELEYKSTANGSKWINVPVANASIRSVTVFGLKPNQHYQWHLRAKCGRSITPYSELVFFKTLATCESPLTQSRSMYNAIPENEVKEIGDDLKAIAMPNPSYAHFNIIAKSSNKKEKITVQVSDALGRIVETRSMYADEMIRLGDRYRPGFYIVRFIQGRQVTQVKLIKSSD